MSTCCNLGNLELQKYNIGFEDYRLVNYKRANECGFFQGSVAGTRGMDKLFENSESIKYIKDASSGSKP